MQQRQAMERHSNAEKNWVQKKFIRNTNKRTQRKTI